jgi:hypothetical protein
MLNTPTEYDGDNSLTKFKGISRQLPASLLRYLLLPDICGGMIRTQMVTHDPLESGHSAWDALYDTTP